MKYRREISILLVAVLCAFAVTFVVVNLVRSVQAEAQRDEVILKQNAELLQRIADLEEIGNKDVAEHRRFNQADHNCIIALLMTPPARRDGLPAQCLVAPAVTGG